MNLTWALAPLPPPLSPPLTKGICEFAIDDANCTITLLLESQSILVGVWFIILKRQWKSECLFLEPSHFILKIYFKRRYSIFHVRVFFIITFTRNIHTSKCLETFLFEIEKKDHIPFSFLRSHYLSSYCFFDSFTTKVSCRYLSLYYVGPGMCFNTHLVGRLINNLFVKCFL